MQPKKLKKIRLNEKKIVQSQLSNGELKHLVGGGYPSWPHDCLLACGPAHHACNECMA